MADLERGYTDATPPSDKDEKNLEWQEEIEEMMNPEKKPGGFVDRNNYGDRL